MHEKLDLLREGSRNSGSEQSACSAGELEGTVLVLTAVFEIDSADAAAL